MARQAEFKQGFVEMMEAERQFDLHKDESPESRRKYADKLKEAILRYKKLSHP